MQHMQRLGRLRSLVHTNANARPAARPFKLDALPQRDSERPRAPVSPPNSRQTLYRNLLSITANPPFSVRKAIEYYFDWPKALHSTKSFNLLIGLALRSASFASVGRLFSAMRAESTPENMETWKLHVRWFVRTGRWDDAWERVLQVTGRQGVTTRLPNNPIPLPLWLELFGSQQRGALRRWVATDRTSSMGSRLDAAAQDTETPLPHRRKRLLPRPCQRPRTVELSRYRMLMRVSPLLASSDQVRILPRTILIITQTMYRVGQRALALSTALSYLRSLPLKLGRCDRRRALDLVNLHLSMVTRHRKPGLKQHFIQRNILHKFLRARPDLAPSPTTLFLVLKPLHGCRRSGTLALQCLRVFQKRWGPHIQSSSVRRRVASLALKEGRLDIVGAMIRLEHHYRACGATFPRTVYTSRRRPWRTLFSRKGAENRKWHLVEERYKRRLISSESKAV